MTICYLDPEDEITGAVARIRAVSDGQAIVVLPPGSRIATSRINFRLLSREAEQKGMTLVAVSDEPGVRALAISAGVPAYDSVASAEGGLAEFARQDRRLAERTGTPDHGRTPERLRPAPSRPVSDATRPMATPRLPAAAATAPEPARPRRADARLRDDEPVPEEDLAERPYRRRRRRRTSLLVPLLAILLAIALVAVAAYGAYTFLPTATITLRPNLIAVGPVRGTVAADQRVAVVDVGEGVVPAQLLAVPLSASGEFAATGTRVVNTRSTGTVRFTSHNTATETQVPAQTRVSTNAGVAFETTESVTIPRAVFGGAAGEADVAVRAVRAGPRGNVAAGAIRVAPEQLGELIFVTNPSATTGGERRETQVVTADDYAAAVAELTGQLGSQLEEALADPETTPRGLTLFPESARLGDATADRPPDELVDTATETFPLTLSASATVVAVNPGLVDQIALERLRALVPQGSTLLPETIEVSHTPGIVQGDLVLFTVAANGSAYRMPDRDVVLSEIRGLSLDQAREIMSQYGVVELTVWPDFVDRVPDQLARINLIIIPPAEGP